MPFLPAMDLPVVETPEIVIDGRAEEPSWGEAARVHGFVVYRPQPGATPANETSALIMASKDALYLYFEASDPNPKALHRGYGRRDSRRNDDYVGVLLDAAGEAERGALFLVNSLGVQTDGIVVRGADDEVIPWRDGWSSWDTKWSSAGRQTEGGYAVEMAIPWSSIRHPDAITQARLMLVRRVASSSELSSWPVFDTSIQGSLVQMADVGGPGRVAKSMPWQFQPEVTATRTDQGIPGDRVGAGGVAPGVTVRFDPGNGVQALATLNPDFSQVESDEAKIDVNQRYSVQYEEKRPFFLEGQEWFNHPMDDLIYTRTMVAPLYGVRATSEREGLTMSALHVWDRQPAATVSEGGGWTAEALEGRGAIATVARGRLALGEDNMVGAIYSTRSITQSDLHHHLAGIDGRLTPTDGVNIEGTLLGSTTRGGDHSGDIAPAALIRKRWNTRRVESLVEATYIAPDFRSENGFQPKADWVELSNETEFFIFPSWRPIPRIFIQPASVDSAWSTEGDPRLFTYEPVFGFWTQGGILVWLQGTFEGESFAGEWLRTARARAMVGGSVTHWMRAWLNVSSGEGVLYDPSSPSVGQLDKADVDVTLQPLDWLLLGPSIGLERFRIGEEEVYSGHVLRVKVEAYATQALWSRFIFDQSSFNDSHALEALFAWEHSPGSAVFVGGSTRQVTGTVLQPTATNGAREWTIFAKTSWVFNG